MVSSEFRSNKILSCSDPHKGQGNKMPFCYVRGDNTGFFYLLTGVNSRRTSQEQSRIRLPVEMVGIPIRHVLARSRPSILW